MLDMPDMPHGRNVPNTAAMRSRTFRFLIVVVLMVPFGGVDAAARPPNVLFIAVDDLRPELGCYGATHITSPALDRLAREGRLFQRHYVQAAACGPSRCSLLTGLRETRSWDVWRADRERETPPDRPVSFPDLFRRNGYRTVCIGKISHEPGGVMDREQQVHQVPFSWDLAYAPAGKWKDPWGAFFCYADGSVREYGYGRYKADKPAWEMADVGDHGYADAYNADEAVRQLRDLKDSGKPFLLAVGFYKPHLPHNAPKKYWDLYDPATIGLPANSGPPRGTNPAISLHKSEELTTHYAWPGGVGRITDEQAIRQRRAYFACVSYVDAQIGRVLDEYRRLGLDQETIVVVWGDHGWHLGEQGVFCKATNYEVATRSALIIRTPGMASPGTPATGLVETIDLYPTLVDICGLTLPDGLAGVSLRPLLDDPVHPGKDGAISGYSLNGYDGVALRTDRWRLVEWRHRKTGVTGLVELYDHENDPGETVNVAADHPDLVRNLIARLHDERPRSLHGDTR
jgi:arylsulfatase A-like enzyme